MLLRREEGQHLNDHRPHAKRPQRAPLQSHVKANRKTLQSACRPWLERLPDAWCWRRRSVGTGQWQLPSRRANQGSCGRHSLRQCAGKESSRQPLKKRRRSIISSSSAAHLAGALERSVTDWLHSGVPSGARLEDCEDEPVSELLKKGESVKDLSTRLTEVPRQRWQVMATYSSQPLRWQLAFGADPMISSGSILR